jgi:hypothetical protein
MLPCQPFTGLKVPMSTTWGFLNLRRSNHKSMRKTLLIVGKDILLAVIGLIISIIIAYAVNPFVREEINGGFQNFL